MGKEMSEIDAKIKEHHDECDTRKCVGKMEKQLNDIHALFFGTYDRPKNGLVMAIDKNSTFRRWAIGVIVSTVCIALIYGAVRAIFL